MDRCAVYSDGSYYYPFKYKVRIPSSIIESEYLMIFRLAEQYLIRSEARIHLGKISDGVADINLIRDRSRETSSAEVPDPLPLISPNLTQEEALMFVLHERRVELFAEWGHRWLDLKRTKLADFTLSTIKGVNWQVTDTLYPVPQSEINKNKNLIQNDGYN